MQEKIFEFDDNPKSIKSVFPKYLKGKIRKYFKTKKKINLNNRGINIGGIRARHRFIEQITKLFRRARQPENNVKNVKIEENNKKKEI